ncbi:MAG: hypothetical protein ABIV43_03075 [Candidatus Saccharimonadales bacterium]
MLIPGEIFPYKPLTANDKLMVTSMCGGRPVEDPELFRNFLVTSGVPTLGSTLMRTFLNKIAWETVTEFGFSDQKSLKHVNRGILFYAGVVSEIGGVGQIPYHREVLQRVADADPRNRAIDGMQRLSAESSSFSNFMADMRPGLDNLADDQRYSFAVMGAGIAHVICTGSIEQTYFDAQSSLFDRELDPDMADLAALFDTEFGQD